MFDNLQEQKIYIFTDNYFDNYRGSKEVKLLHIEHKWLHFPHHGSKSRPEKFSIWASNFLRDNGNLSIWDLSNYSTIEIENYYISYEKNLLRNCKLGNKWSPIYSIVKMRDKNATMHRNNAE